ncbi:mucin-2-like [Uloborus diversus]|uniref:mucin-2-like n=1 Tax=Uloborus diversus TaxID=327109 RepID=UPI002409EB4D|nr:mucin-2-like [Uloborus diversus]
MQRARRLPVSALNPHFTCVLCEGYIIDATTITECVHSFCRTCIVRYLEHNKYCPVCDAQVHETKPLQGIRFDQTLQDIVYKLIPGLYQNEMQRRKQFYAEHPEAAVHCTSEERGEGAEQKFFYSPDETISLTLEHRSGSKDGVVDESSETPPGEKNATTRHLNCPAALAVSQLKKFISMKFSLPHTYQVEIMYADHVLRDDDTLMDIAYIYAWKRAGPMKFHYNVTQRIPRKWEKLIPKISKPMVITEPEPKQTIPSIPSVCSEIPEKAEGTQQNELEKMEVDETPAEINQCSVELERISPSNDKPITNCDHPATGIKSSSMETNQKMEISEPVNVVSTTSASPSAKPSLSTNGPMSYGTVKLVSTSDTNTILSTSNGVRLKLIHPPHTNPRGRPRKSKKKSKAAPIQKLARLAPYPPPSTPVPLAAAPMPHLQSLTVGKLVPSVMTSLAPALVTTLVSSTANTLCNVSRNTFMPQVAPYMNQTNASTVTKTVENTFVPTVLSNGLPENSIQQSSTFAGQTACQPITCQSNVNSLSNHHTLVAIPPVNSSVISLPQVSSSIVTVDNNASSKEEPTPSKNVTSEGTAPTSDVSPSPDCIEVDSSEKSDSVCGKDSLCDNSVSTTDAVTELKSDIQTSNSSSVQVSLPSSSDSEEKNVSIQQSVSSVDSSSKMECETIANSIPTSSSELTKTAKPISVETSSVSTEVKLNGAVCNGVQSPPINPSISQPMFCKSFSMDRKATEAYETSVKNSISAEFSDNDDLGCQPDLVVDEQKMDSSDNEDDADTALRKKIKAIAEKEDEADVTDDTEADSGRASDISSQARSSCDDDIGSPAAPVVSTSTNDVVMTSSSSTQLLSFTAPVTTTSSVVTPAPSEESHRPAKASSLNDVIDNLYRQKKDTLGALDLSTCARKAGETPSSRPKAVANPVLDIKHRQQAYLPAPNKQHTACPPAPKHPTSPSLLMHHLSVHHHNMMAAQQMAQHGKGPHLQVPLHCNNMVYPSPPRSSPSSVPAKATPTYNNSHTVVPPPVPTAHQGMVPFLPSSFLQYNSAMLNSFAKGNIAPLPLPGRSTPKTVQSSPPPSFNLSKSPSSMPHYGKQSSPSMSSHRKSSSTTDSHINKSPLSRGSPRSPPVIQVSHPRASPTLMRMLTQHRSASPAPCPKPIQTTTAQSTPVTSTSSSSSSSYKPSSSIPIYKKADSFKNYTSKFRGSNLTVYNPDPNGYRQKIVIKNLDIKTWNKNHSSKHNTYHAYKTVKQDFFPD